MNVDIWLPPVLASVVGALLSPSVGAQRVGPAAPGHARCVFRISAIFGPILVLVVVMIPSSVAAQWW
jgi:hypothetical protein